MKVVILGCGRTGALVAGRLSAGGQSVTIIDTEQNAFARLDADFRGSRIVGNGTEQDTLRRAGIEEADIFVALTQGDNRNIMASQIARVIFNVPQVYTRIKDPLRAEAFTQSGLQTFCTTCITADFIQRTISLDPQAGTRTERRLPARTGS